MCRELTPNSQPVIKKIEKTRAKEKQSPHKTIFMWFGNLPTFTELQGFHYYQGEIQSAATMFHSLSRRRQQQQNPNHQKWFLYPARRLIHECSSLGLSAQASTPWTKFQKISH